MARKTGYNNDLMVLARIRLHSKDIGFAPAWMHPIFRELAEETA